MKRTPEPPDDDLAKDVSHLRGWNRTKTYVSLDKVKLPTRRITINIDSDIIAIFKAEALQGGPPYQVAMNQALRRYLRDRETEVDSRTRKAVLSTLRDPEVTASIAATVAPLLSARSKAPARSSRKRKLRAGSSAPTTRR